MLFKLRTLARTSLPRFKTSIISANLTSLVSHSDVEKNHSSDNWKVELEATMRIFPNFITTEEEDSLFQEVEPYMKKLRYEFSHWDDAIHGYRETEKINWNENNSNIISRIHEKAFPPGSLLLRSVHVLDLAADGKIKPHVDSVRFCGDIIAGLSLLSDCIMRLTMVGHEELCGQDFLLPKRSLYIMSGAARYQYKHEVLGSDESVFEGRKIQRSRRISVICRNEPREKKD